jgi:protease-4
MHIPRPLQYFFIVLLLLLFAGGIAYYVGNQLLERGNDIPNEKEPYQTADGYSCNIAVIPLSGQLWASQSNADAQTATDNSANVSGEEIVAELERAQDDSSIKGVVLQIDSPGGSGVGGEMIANALKRLQKPSAALILGSGDSAAYWAATGANTIIASPASDVADIGVTGSYLDQSGQNAQKGQKFIQIAAGQYKDVGNPDMPITATGQAYLQKLVDAEYQTFTKEVAANRNLPLATVQKLANGNSLNGSMAIGTGLIDQLGDAEMARQWFAMKLGKGSNPILCN